MESQSAICPCGETYIDNLNGRYRHKKKENCNLLKQKAGRPNNECTSEKKESITRYNGTYYQKKTAKTKKGQTIAETQKNTKRVSPAKEEMKTEIKKKRVQTPVSPASVQRKIVIKEVQTPKETKTTETHPIKKTTM